MHIGFLTPEYVTPRSVDGGLANYLRKVGRMLAERGHQVSVLMLSDQNAQWTDGPVTVHEVKQLELAPRLRRWLLPVVAQVISARRLARAVWRIHQRTPFDILQASSYMAPGYALRRNGRVPLVCRVSSYTPLVRSAYGRSRSLKEYLSDWLEIRQVLDAEAAFAPSRFMAAAYARMEGYQPQVIRTPVELSGITPDPTYYDAHLAGVSYLLFFGTLSRIKGADLLAEVVPPVLARHPALSFGFVGRDDGLPNGQKVFDYVRLNCAAFESRLHYSPALPKAQLYAVIANAVGVVMPSRVDNYPNACLEAQALGVPVVGADESSLEEMIVDGKTGFLARNGDLISLQAVIEQLLAQTPDQRAQMQEHLQASMNMILSEDRVGQLIAFYQSVIHRFHAAEG